MKKFIQKRLYIILLILFILSYLFLIFLYYKNGLSKIDNFIYNNLYFNNYITIFFKIITNFGSALIFILITIALLIICKNKKYSIYIGINLLLSFTINYGFKILFRRDRPIDINLIEEIGYSFPSGHTTVSTAFYGFIIYLIYKSTISKKIKKILIPIISILILLIGISRIYLGVHYATDVLASYTLSIIYLLLFIKYTHINKTITIKK